jgi:glutaredoxin 2
MTREEAYDIIESLNQTAYDHTYRQWVEADEASYENEELREEASSAQQEIFKELYRKLNIPTRRAIQYFVDTDEDFADDFHCWYGEE